MGGFSYDRDDYDDSSSSSWGSSSSWRDSAASDPAPVDDYSGGTAKTYSAKAAKKMSATSLDKTMWGDHKITSKSKNPIIVVLDVTGSNIDLARIVYDKMPMFYGQIEQKKYLDDFDICFMAVGDAEYDDYPLQVGDFGKGIEIDSYLEKIVLESGGGPGIEESYELAALYLATQMELQPGAKPIVFFQGDENPRNLRKSLAEKAKIPWEDKYGNMDVWAELNRICGGNVFLLQSSLRSDASTRKVTETWESFLEPQHVVKAEEKKSVIDLMLGIISMVSNARDLDSYKVDMLERGQTEKRISMVSESLKGLSTELSVCVTNNALASTAPTTKTGSKGKRL